MSLAIELDEVRAAFDAAFPGVDYERWMWSFDPGRTAGIGYQIPGVPKDARGALITYMPGQSRAYVAVRALQPGLCRAAGPSGHTAFQSGTLSEGELEPEDVRPMSDAIERWPWSSEPPFACSPSG
jgi:hypothetical protein